MRFAKYMKNRLLRHLSDTPKPANMNCHEIPFEEARYLDGCQGCGGSYDNNHVLIVDGLGPICHNCLYNLAALLGDARA